MSKQYQKHAKLAKPSGGAWGNAELALIGAPCNVIRQTAQKLIAHFKGKQHIGFVDADHHPAQREAFENAAVHFTDKGAYQRIDVAGPRALFTRRMLFNGCDLVFVNGNHYDAQQQIVFIHRDKPLDLKLAKLTDVQLILLAEEEVAIPDFLSPLSLSIPVISLNDDAGIYRFFEHYLAKQIPALNGLVLVGGNSTRMGTDKSLLEYHGKAQREYVRDLLQPLCEEVFISCNARQRADIALPKIEDHFLGIGPMGGLLSAFQSAPHKAWLSVACDMPHLSPDTLDYLIEHRDPTKLATAFVNNDEGFPEPLLTIWEPRAYPVLLQALSMGSSCPRKVLIHSDVALLAAPDRMALVNTNDMAARHEAVSLINQKIIGVTQRRDNVTSRPLSGAETTEGRAALASAPLNDAGIT